MCSNLPRIQLQIYISFNLNSAYDRWAVFSRVTLAILAQNINK